MKSKSQKKLIRARKSNDQSIYNLVLQLLIAITCSLISSYYSFSFHWISYPTLKQFLLNPSSISSFISPTILFIAMNIIVIILIAEWSFTSSSSSPADIYDEYVKRSRIRHRLATVNSDLHEKTAIKKPKEEKPNELGFRVLEEKKSRIRHRLASVNYDLQEKTVIKKSKEEKPDELGFRVLEEKKSRIRHRLACVNSDLPEKTIVEKAEEEKLDELIGVEEEEVNDDHQVVGIENGDYKVDETEELNRRVENFIARVNRRMWVEAHCLNVHGEEEMAKSFDNIVC